MYLPLRLYLIWLLLSLTTAPVSFASQQIHPEAFRKTISQVLKPVYRPLAEEIVHKFDLAEKRGIAIDLGSGPGDLIIELCGITENMHWVNADINPGYFPGFLKRADEAGFSSRVSAMYADAKQLPFRNNIAEIIVSRGSFHLWGDLKTGLSEVYRVLKPGGTAYIGRGFSKNLPVEVARNIRNRQKEAGKELKYDVGETAETMKTIMEALNIQEFRIIVPKPPGAGNISYGIWLEFHKPEE